LSDSSAMTRIALDREKIGNATVPGEDAPYH
jgi:hypothetical protein